MIYLYYIKKMLFLPVFLFQFSFATPYLLSGKQELPQPGHSKEVQIHTVLLPAADMQHRQDALGRIKSLEYN